MFDNFNFISHPIKNKWGTWDDIFVIWVTKWTFLASRVFPLVWTVALNHLIFICLHQQIGLFLAQTFLPQNFRAASVSARFVKKICFFTHFLYFFFQWFLASFVFKKQGFVNVDWYFLNRRELDLQRRDGQNSLIFTLLAFLHL